MSGSFNALVSSIDLVLSHFLPSSQVRGRRGRIGVLACKGAAIVALMAIAVPCTVAEDVGTGESWRLQRFEAWGTSIGWMGNVIGGWSDAGKQDEVYDLLFDDVNHLGINFGRYNIGAGQAANLSIPRPGAEIEGWVPNRPTNVRDSSTWQYDWTADETQRAFLQAAIERGVSEVEAYANSAPWWMTISGDSTGASGNGQDNLATANYGAFAEYLTTVASHFENNLGTRFSTLAPMNEPGAGWWNRPGNQEGMNVSRGANQSNLLLATRTAIQNQGLQIRLVAPEETASSESLTSYQQLSTAAKQAVDQINTHTYPFQGGTTNESLLNLYLIAATTGKRFYVSEFGVGGVDQLDSAIQLASRISTDIYRGGVQGWTYWQAVEDNNGSGWGLITSPFASGAETFEVRKQYAAMRQFTSYIRPGSHILDVGGDNILAAYNAEDDATVIVVVSESGAFSGQYDFIDKPISETRMIRTDRNGDYRSLGAASVNGESVSLSTSSNGGAHVTTIVVHHRENLLNNPSFNLGGAPQGAAQIGGGWYTEGGARFYPYVDSGNGSTGAAALWADRTVNSGAVKQSSVAFDEDQAGVAFQLSLDVLFQNNTSGGQRYDADTLIGVEFLGADGQSLTHASNRDYLTTVAPMYNDSAYRVFRSERFVAPEGTRYVRPVIRYENVGSSSNSWTYLDNARLEQVSITHRGRKYAGGAWQTFHSWQWDADTQRDGDLIFSDLATTGYAAIEGSDNVTSLTFDRADGMSIGGSGALHLIADDFVTLIDARRGANLISADLVVEDHVAVRVLPGASLTLASSVSANGHRIEKQGAGSLTFAGGLQLSGGEFELPLMAQSRVHIDGAAQLDGKIVVSAGVGAMFAVGQQFNLLTFDSLTTPASALDLPELPESADWKVTYLATTLRIEVVAAQLPGDYNGDGIVNAADYSVWRDQQGSFGEAVTADGNQDGLVNSQDYEVWVENYGRIAFPEAQATPEPATISTLVLCLLARCRARRPPVHDRCPPVIDP